MTDLEHDLASAADRIRVGLGDVDMVMARGRERRARRQRAIGGVTALALIAGVAAMVTSDRETRTPVATMPALSRGDAGLHWEVLSTSDGLGMGSGVNGSGPFYALSTAPGQSDVNKARPSRVVWRSEDGIEWTPASTLGKDLYLSDLSPADGRVYAVGTAPAQAGVKRRGDVVAGWSDDGGKTFSKKALPIDWAGIETVSTSVAVLDTQIASTDNGSVAVAIVQSSLDVPRLLPNGVTAPDGWATTATGVDILGPEKDNECPAGYTDDKAVFEKRMEGDGSLPGIRRANVEDDRPTSREIEPTWCFDENNPETGVSVSPQEARGVVRSLTFADLNVAGDALTAAKKQPFAFFAEDSSTDFDKVDLGGARGDAVYLDVDDSGFRLFSSSYARGNGTVESTDLASTDGRTWTSAAGPSELRWVSAAGVLNGQRVVIGDGGNGSVIARADGSGGWSVTPLSSVVDGGRPVHVGAAGIGPLGIVVAGYVEPEKNEDGVAQNVLAFTRDGSTWETQPVEAIAGKPVGQAIRITVSGQRAVVALSGGGAKEGEPAKPQTILVATPK